MHVIIWEFWARRGYESELEAAYGPGGAWTQLFERGEGYLGTELLRDLEKPRRYITIDRWVSQHAFEAFRSQRISEYEALDRACESLTEEEGPTGSFLCVSPPAAE